MTLHSLPDASATTASFEKLSLMVRYWLLGRNYTQALRAMEFAASHHTGVRLDGAPEFSHQVWQVAYARTIEPMLMYPEETLCVIFLHDVVEDYSVTLDEIEDLFGKPVSRGTDSMSKVVEGHKKDAEVYFEGLARDPIGSVAKGVDRVHNHKTMADAFSDAKQYGYMDETQDDILPMLKAARRAFPEQELVYENIKHLLIQQMDLYRYALAARA
jgi:(p)ppGpp synthase/HD superfamily hydrolase